jgi:hypothetical protein
MTSQKEWMIGRTLDSMIDILEKQIVFYDTDRDMEFYNEKDRFFTNGEQLKTKSKNTKLKAVADRNALQKHYDDIFNINTSKYTEMAIFIQKSATVP